MRSLLSDGRSVDLDADDRAVEAFAALWESGQASLDRFWSEIGPFSSPSVLAELVKIDLEARFKIDQRPRAAEYFERFPELTESRNRVVSIVYEEFCLLEENGDEPDSREFCEGYEPWRDSLLSQLVYHRELSKIVSSDIPKVKFPQPGDTFSKYHLRSVLGRGGVACVYLATEDELGGRQLAIKISAAVGREPSIMATLDHRNIVPILTVADSGDGLRGICMPYRPGFTLEDLIRKIGRGKPSRTARAVWDVLNQAEGSADLKPDDDKRSGWKGFPVSGTFSDAVAWIGLTLANALAYFHDRDVLHRDIKPANVLLCYREGPQVLDFNLALDPREPEHVSVALKGGTLPYMSPEQLHAFVDPSGWDDVTTSSDIYALGLVLQELVTGQPPDMPNIHLKMPRAIQGLLDRRLLPPIPVREINPGVPPALESIIACCLAVAPSARYKTAYDLAEDLQRFLNRKSLVHAANTSRIERATNCLHRNRPLFGGIVLILFMSLLAFWPRTDRMVQDLPAFREAVEDFRSGQPKRLQDGCQSFDQLRKDHPGSAWPRIYLALALEKIDGTLERANPFVLETCQCSDAEAALRSCLNDEPKSATVLLALGIVLAKNPPYEPALQAFDESIAIDRNRILPYLERAKVERKLKQDEAAIRDLSRAIELGRGTASVNEIYSWRVPLLALLSRTADRKFVEGSTSADHLEGEKILKSLEATLAAMDQDRQRMTEPGGGTLHRFYQNFYLGFAESARAVFEADQKDGQKAKILLGSARNHLNEAASLLPELGLPQQEISPRVMEQIRQLDRRYDTVVKPLLDSPAPP